MVTKWGGFIENLAGFDAPFWGVSPREALRMDPQQRWLLEVAWEAIEDSGTPPSRLRGTNVGVFVGVATNDYGALQLANLEETDVFTMSGSTLSIASNRLSYMLDLTGPSMSIDTACSSSLVAVWSACRSIWAGTCDAALAGGVNALITPNASVGFSRASMLSPSGQCFAFDARANGYVRGEGAGIVYVKPLDRALADRDRIYAVIRAAVSNQDGHTSSMTVPGIEGQSAMLRAAYREAEIDPRRVVYVEAHGTGTPVGDPIEATALGRVLGGGRSADSACLIGSVKTNVGHLEAGSGLPGLIKAALVLHHDTVPPNANFQTINPNIPFDSLGLRVATKLQPLPQGDGIPVVGVNSFGFGGTNAHVVLEKAPAPAPVQPVQRTADRPLMLPISARDEEALRRYASAYRKLLDDPSRNLPDICYSAGARKEGHDHRVTILGSDAEQMRERLDAWLGGEAKVEGVVAGRAASAGNPVFVFTGQGAQWWGMGRALLGKEPVFRAMIERIDAMLRHLASWSLLEEMTRDEADSNIDRTDIAQPAIFALQVALAELWQSWGIKPSKVIGHSVGEVAAAYCAGVYSLEDAVAVIYHRSRLQNATGGHGRMLAAGITPAEGRRAIGPHGDRVQIAVFNSPNLITLAGDTEPLEAIAADLEKSGAFVRWLRINYAFHTHQMEPIKDELLRVLRNIKPQRARVPFISTVTGGMLSGEKIDAAYWWKNVRQPVLFGPAVSALARGKDDTYLEIGPHPALAGSISECLQAEGRTAAVFHSLKRKTDDSLEIMTNLAGLQVRGVAIDWAAVTQSSGTFVRLPHYPWKREQFWLESKESERARVQPAEHPFLGARINGPHPLWQTDLHPRRFPYMNDHRFWDTIVFPGAGYVEIGLAIAHRLFPGEAHTIDDLEIKKGLFIDEDAAPTLQVTFEPDSKTFAVYSATGDKESWELHALGRLTRAPGGEPASLDIEAVRTSLRDHFTHEQFYIDTQLAGYQFGPNFSHIQNVWRIHGDTLAEVLSPDEVMETADRYQIHPAVLDACFQLFMKLNPERDAKPEDNFFLPHSFRRVRVYAKVPKHLFVRAKLLLDDGKSTIADLFVYDETGRRVADILGFRADKFDNKQTTGAAGFHYQFRWESAAATEVAERKPGRYLVFTDRGGVGDSLIAQLRARGDRVLRASHGEKFIQQSDSEFGVPVGRESDVLTALGDLTQLSGIVHCWALDRPDADDLDVEALQSAQREGVMSLLRVLRTPQAAGTAMPRMWLLGRDIYPVVDSDLLTGLASAPLVGLMRVANNEFFPASVSMIDIGNGPHDVAAICIELDQSDEEREIAYRNGERFALRLHRVRPSDLPQRQSEAVGHVWNVPNTAGKDGTLETCPTVTPYRLETSKPGILRNLGLHETPRPDPSADEIEIRVKAGGVNFRDVMKALGTYPGNPIDLLWFGDDVAGVVERVGKNVRHLKPGDEVVGMVPYCFRAFVLADPRVVFKKPASMSFEEAATLPTVFLTAHYALNHLARMQRGERILIHAGAGGVGQAAIQIARRLGLEIFATAGSDDKRKMLADMGVHHVMSSRSLAFAEQIREITKGRGVDAVLNSLAGDFITESFSVLAPFGRFLEIGKVDIYRNAKLGLAALKDNISYFVIDLAQHLQHKADYVAQLFAELKERLDAKDYGPLPHKVFPVTQVVEAFQYMAQGKHIGKNVLSFDVPSIPIAPCTQQGHLLRPDATYLITGCAGGFGLEVAKWMTRQGARHLVLMSRSGPREDDARKAIDDMRAQGVDVRDARADVADFGAVSKAVAMIAREMPPLRGVVHAAMVLDDDAIRALDEKRFNTALTPKMAGAWNLHRATLGLPLEHFVSFSSVSSLAGLINQANYNAGNFFLDSLASYRHARGLPALTINWGTLRGAGFVERNKKTADFLDKIGAAAFNMEEAVTILGELMLLDQPQVAAAHVDWRMLSKAGPGVARSNTYRALVQESGEAASGGSLLARLHSAGASSGAIVESFLASQVAGVFGVAEDKVDREAPLNTLGLDSLMAVELAHRIEREIGTSVPMNVMLSGPSIKVLAQTLLRLVAPSLETGGEGEATQATSSYMLPLKHVEPRDQFPLSEGQQALWFLYRLAPNSSAYNLVFSATLRPHISIDTIRRAFASVLKQHPLLDVTFSEVDGVPMQKLRKSGEVDFRVHDARKLDPARLKALLVEHANRPFDLERGPVIRLELFQTGEDEQVALMCLHHIVADAWSVALVFGDLFESHFALEAGETPSYHPQPFSYQDYVAWEQDHLASPTGQRLGEYWLKQLQGAPMQIDLPTDHARPPVQTFRGATHTFQLDEDLSLRVLALRAEQNVTLFTLTLAAFQTLMHRYCRQDDIVVGSPLAGRVHPELAGMVGYFINPVALRSKVDGDPTFADYLKQTAAQVSGALEHQQYPFSRLVRQLNLPRDPSRPLVYQVSFAMERVPGVDEADIATFLIGKGGHKLYFGDISVETLDLALRQAQFEITLVIEEAGGSIFGCWQYNRDLFEPETIAHLNALYAQVLRSITDNPLKRLSEIELLTPMERANYLKTASGPGLTFPEPALLHEMIARRVTLTPSKTAVRCAGKSLTYRDLDARANGLAATLRERGVGPDVSVGVFVSRSTDMVVALLGVLKAGGCYVPMDPDFPASRLQQMLENAQPRVIITSRDVALRLPGSSAGAALAVEDVKPQSAPPRQTGVTPDHLAYIIYTSGSTGTPKGVEIPHRAIVNLLASMAREPGFSSADRLLAVTTLSFDIAALEIFLPLLQGGQVCVATRDDARDGRRLATLLEQYDATVMQATPTAWHLLLESGWTGKSDLRALCGGEALSSELASRLLPAVSELWNVYGPTETTVWSTCDQVQTDNILIGRPIANTVVCILDDNRRPLPAGVVGELYIGGLGLARGYHGRPDLTAERFLDIALPGGTTERLYRTGDLARWTLDGKLQCLGRVDLQVKVRGHRIELEDIEAALSKYEGVKQAVVNPIGRGAECRLIGYVCADGERPEPSQLQAFLRERLPEYMVPSAFVFLDALPRTPNGKIDRAALPAPDAGSGASIYVATRTELERSIAEVWEKVLERPAVGVDDDFFALGGHSLQAMQVVSSLSAKLGRDISIRSLFVAPTVARLAEEIEDVTFTAARPTQRGVNRHVQIVHEPIARMIADGNMPRVQAAALATIPAAALAATGLNRNLLVDSVLAGKPMPVGVYDSPVGRIALIVLPRLDSEVYADPAALVNEIDAANQVAETLGARCVSLTGLLPSATGYGRKVRALKGLTVTTGHATTAASVVLNIVRTIQNAGRRVDTERMAFLGLGSIGGAAIRLLLATGEHPRAIDLCDVFAKEADLTKLRRELLDYYDFAGEIRVLAAKGRTPDAIYDATTIVGATNVPDVLDVDRLQRGAIVIDDSAPHAFRVDKALKRIRERGDILVSEGGILQAPESMQQTVFVPEPLASIGGSKLVALFARKSARHIMGCIFSSALTAAARLAATVGTVSIAESRRHLAELQWLRFTAPAAMLDDEPLGESYVRDFAAQFGVPAPMVAESPSEEIVPERYRN